MTGAPTNDLRVELRTRNNVLWHAIFDTHKTVAEFCRAHDLCHSSVGDILNLKASPYMTKRTGARQTSASFESKTLTKIADRLVQITRILAEDLFPRGLYLGIIPTKMIAEIPSSMYRGLSAAKHLTLPPAQEGIVDAREAREALESALSTLTPREETVLRMRFGLDSPEESTCEEVGQKLGCGGARILQIQAKALRKLQHRSRSRKLDSFRTQLKAQEPA